jgi:hypothetical protein
MNRSAGPVGWWISNMARLDRETAEIEGHSQVSNAALLPSYFPPGSFNSDICLEIIPAHRVSVANKSIKDKSLSQVLLPKEHRS